MAVQQLGKKQAKKEKKNQKDLDDEFARDEEKPLEDTQRMLDAMERIKKQGKGKKLPKKTPPPSSKTPPLQTPPPSKKTGKPNKTPKKEGIDIKPLGPILKAKDGGMMNKRLTKTVPPKKGPNSQGMRGTGAAIRGTKFKGVF